MISLPRDVWGSNIFKIMIDELGEARTLEHLGIHRTTLRRLLKPNAKVPRAYTAALFWETSYGRSIVDVSHYNERQLHFTQMTILKQRVAFEQREVARLTAIIEHMEKIMDFGSANSPALNEAPVFKLVGKAPAKRPFYRPRTG